MSSGERILLVTDIPDHAGTYARALDAVGFHVTTARTGAEAQDCAPRAVPDLAVVDVRLPDMSGWELCRQMKAEPAIGPLPVIMLTADVSKTCAEDSARAGCNAWLAHPTRADDLVRTVRQVLALDADGPRSPADALLGVNNCPACAGGRIKATLRMGRIQNYCCRECGLCWRVDTEPA